MKKKLFICLLVGSMFGSSMLKAISVFAEETEIEKIENEEQPKKGDNEKKYTTNTTEESNEVVNENPEISNSVDSGKTLDSEIDKTDIPNDKDQKVPNLNLTFISTTNKYQTQSDFISLAVDLKINEGEKVPTGTEVTVDMPEKAWADGTITEVEKPNYVDVSYALKDGIRMIKIKYKNEIVQEGTVGFIIKGRANEVGTYSVTAQSDYFGEKLSLHNNSFEIIDSSTTDIWSKSYFETTGKKFPLQATKVGVSNQNGFVKGTFLNDGNDIPITAEIKMRSFVETEAGKPTWSQGIEHANSGAKVMYAFFSLDSSSKGFHIDHEKLSINMLSGGASAKDTYYTVYNPENPNEFYITPRRKDSTLGNAYQIAVSVPVIAEDENSSYTLKERSTYGESTNTTLTFNASFEKIPDTTGFAPRILGPDTAVEVPYGTNYDLMKLPGLTAKDVEDGDEIAKNLKVRDNGGFDTTKPGTYFVTYEVTDSMGNTVTKQFQLIVGENPNPIGGKITIRYVNEDNENLVEPIIYDDYYIGQEYKSEPQVFDGWTLKEIPSNANGECKEEAQEVIYKYNGNLSLISVPSLMHFGQNTIPKVDTTYMLKEKDKSFIVRDTRKYGSKWEMTAKLNQELTLDGGNRVIKNGLLYKDGDITKNLSSTESTVIVTHKTDSHDAFYLDKSWDENNGLFLSVKAGNILKGTYSGEIEWNLIDAP